MEDKIAKILHEELCYAYCNTCAKGLDEDLCGDCHRKYMNWSLSKDAAQEIARKICEAIQE